MELKYVTGSLSLDTETKLIKCLLLIRYVYVIYKLLTSPKFDMRSQKS